MNHIYILFTILFTIYSQLIMRWQVSLAGPLPPDLSGKISFVASLLLNPWVLSGILATFFSGISWMLAMTKFEVSYAYPYISLNYVLILASSVLLFHESLTLSKVLGTSIIILGIVVLARG